MARTVVIVDDHAGFRVQAAQMLEAAGYEVVGSCSDGRSGLAAMSALRPDLVLLDVQLPDANVAGVAIVKYRLYDMRLMTEFNRAVGYLLKDRVSDLATFASDVRRIGNGSCVIDPDLVARLVAKKREGDPLGALSDRERKVLALMAQGRSNSALSTELCLSAKTIEPTSVASSPS